MLNNSKQSQSWPCCECSSSVKSGVWSNFCLSVDDKFEKLSMILIDQTTEDDHWAITLRQTDMEVQNGLELVKLFFSLFDFSVRFYATGHIWQITPFHTHSLVCHSLMILIYWAFVHQCEPTYPCSFILRLSVFPKIKLEQFLNIHANNQRYSVTNPQPSDWWQSKLPA